VRGATGGAAAATDARAGETDQPAGPMPPAVTPEAQDLRYHDQLQGQAGTAPPASSSDKAANAAPAAEPMLVDEPQGKETATTTAATPAKSDKPAPKETTSAAKAAAAPAATTADNNSGGWTVQVNAFRSRDNANKQVAQLKTQGLPAFIVEGAPNALFAVRVGPYPQRADAERAAAKLRAQFPGARIQR
jgi:cell division septation protein DedD